MVDSGRDANEDEALKARLARLKGALEEKRAQEPARNPLDEVSAGATGRAFSLGVRVLSEFVAGLIVGVAIGLALDGWLSTKPLFLIVFLALGTAAGFWNVYRIAAGPTGPRRGGS